MREEMRNPIIAALAILTHVVSVFNKNVCHKHTSEVSVVDGQPSYKRCLNQIIISFVVLHQPSYYKSVTVNRQYRT